MKATHILIAAAAIVMAAACGNNAAKKSVEAPAEPQEEAVALPAYGVNEGQHFTDFEIPQEDGSVVRLSDYVGKGKYILVDFWASWCGPCRGEIPNLKNVYEQFAGEDFDMLSVAVWDEVEDTYRAIAEEELPWNQIVGAGMIPTDLYGIEGIPHIILFGPDGTILKRNLRGPAIGKAVAAALGR